MRQVETDVSLSMPQGTKQAQDLMAPPPHRLAFSFQCTNTGQHWTDAGMRSSLTSASAGRSQSHIKLSENPKVPVRSVNSSIVPAPPPPRLKGPSVTRHPLQWSGPPPHWVHRYSDTLQIHLQLLGVRQIEIEDSQEACFCLFWCKESVELQRLGL